MYGSVAKLGGRQLFLQLVIPDPAISYFTERRRLVVEPCTIWPKSQSGTVLGPRNRGHELPQHGNNASSL